MPRIEPDIVIRFSNGKREYAPGEELTAELSVQNWDALNCHGAEASVVWRTVGKGDEDLHVHYFRRFQATGEEAVDLGVPFVIETELPASPLSYDGVIVKVCWCVRLRLFQRGFKESNAEAAFRLGNVTAPRVAEVQK